MCVWYNIQTTEYIISYLFICIYLVYDTSTIHIRYITVTYKVSENVAHETHTTLWHFAIFVLHCSIYLHYTHGTYETHSTFCIRTVFYILMCAFKKLLLACSLVRLFMWNSLFFSDLIRSCNQYILLFFAGKILVMWELPNLIKPADKVYYIDRNICQIRLLLLMNLSHIRFVRMHIHYEFNWIYGIILLLWHDFRWPQLYAFRQISTLISIDQFRVCLFFSIASKRQ